MNEEFNKIIAKMQPLLDQLSAEEPLTRSNLQGVPERGVYVLYEHGRPIYVGRSDRLKERLLEHSRPSSWSNSATFAFNLANADAVKRGLDYSGMKRTQIERDPSFSELFAEAKRRVADMEIRVIKLKDPIEQTLFEVYAAVALTTKNDYENH